MRSRRRAAAAAVLFMMEIAALGRATPAAAQVEVPRAVVDRWNDPRTLELVRRATERRALQLADTGLVDYHATAHGYLTFLAQLGSGPGGDFTEPPKVVKADELGLEVYWKAPNLSKQIIQGRRDTLLLPTDIQYHRDHLGIIQNNFPSIIRLGDGDEVLDVPHPLSAQGLAVYDFAITDSLSIGAAGRAIQVLQVSVRPKDDRQPRVIGALYIEQGEAQVVRMAFDFTRAAFRDRQLEDLFVILENGLVEGRFWLPRRQEIEIRRQATWMDFPARGIIRGRWEIGTYRINANLPFTWFAGPEIVSVPPSQLKKYPFPAGRILDSLPPDVRAVSDADVREVREQARALVREQALRGTRSTALAARRISDFVRVDRVEGLAPGAGVSRRFGGGWSASVLARYGTSDEQVRGTGGIGWQQADGRGVSLDFSRELRDTGIEPERSTLVNSLAAQEFGSDYTDPFDEYGLALTVDVGRELGLRWRLQAAAVVRDSVGVRATPATGRYEPTVPAWKTDGWRASVIVDHPTSLSVLGTEVRASGQASVQRLTARDPFDTFGAPRYRDLRAVGTLDIERPFGRRRLVAHTAAGAVRAQGDDSLPPEELVYLGGPVTGAGYDFHQFAGRFGASQRVEWRFPVPFPAIPLGRFGRAGGSATLAPFAQTVYLARPTPVGLATETRGGWFPSVGLGSLLFFDVLRVDVARGLRDGRWSFSVDAGRDFWRIL